MYSMGVRCLMRMSWNKIRCPFHFFISFSHIPADIPAPLLACCPSSRPALCSLARQGAHTDACCIIDRFSYPMGHLVQSMSLEQTPSLSFRRSNPRGMCECNKKRLHKWSVYHTNHPYLPRFQMMPLKIDWKRATLLSQQETSMGPSLTLWACVCICIARCVPRGLGGAEKGSWICLGLMMK